MADVDRWLIVGLGNPGEEYRGTRHNIGFEVVELLAREVGVRLRRQARVQALTATATLAGQAVVLAEPSTFMNRSGAAVAALVRYYSVPGAQVVVVHDELDLPLGSLRLKNGGGAGGHNGLRSITTSLGTPDYDRVRVGIGRPPGTMDAADYVLRRFSRAERPEADVAVGRAGEAVESLISSGLSQAQNHYNS